MRTIYSYLLLSLVVIVITSCNKNNTPIIEKLNKINGVKITALEKFDTTLFKSAYEIMIDQPYDHNDISKGNFKQRVLIFHSGNYSKPIVMETHGYNIWSDKETELCRLIKCNNLTVEHRFFGDSRPDSIPWKYLTIKQAAADHHRIIQIFKKIYNGKWITTGISKGGQTAIFHRTLYPNDVDISIPYVAPVNYSREDKRIHNFINNIPGTKEDRQKIKDFQIAMFKNKAKLIPLLKKYAQKKNYTFKMGFERALELNILEYSFAFWQWGNSSVDKIPSVNTTPEKMFKHLIRVSSFSFFEDKRVEVQRPFYYQALTEMGMYSYEIKPFKKFLKDTTDVTFDFTAPKGVSVKFRPELTQMAKKFVETTDKQMMYIYGEYDTWSATSAQISENNKNSIKMVLPKGHHGTRIRHFKDKQKEKIYKTLETWLNQKIERK